MAAVVCTQCGAEAPHSAGDGSLAPPKRCRFCGQVFGAPVSASAPPAAGAPPVFGGPPPRRTAPQAPIEEPANTSAARRGGPDPLSMPFDAQDRPAPSPPRPRRSFLLIMLLMAAGLSAAILKPVQMGLSPDWYQSLVGKRVDAVAQRELEQGMLALNRGSSRGLIEAKQSFERALKIDSHYAQAQAALAETELAMAQALLDAAQDMAHFSQGLSRKEMRRAQHDADVQRNEAKAWSAAATPSAQAAVQLAPNTPAANRVMAELLRQQADLKGASAWAQGGRKSVSEDAGMMVVQADLMAPHDLAGACALLGRALQKAPNNNRARYKLAQYLLKKKETARALEAVNGILAAAPEHELAQQMLMKLQPAASQADKVQRPLVLSFAAELQPAARPAAVALGDAGGAGGAAPPPAAPEASPAAEADDAGDDAPSAGPPMTFWAQAKTSMQNIGQSLASLWSSSSTVPEPVAPSDLGAGMPIPSDPAPQDDAAAPSKPSETPSPAAPVAPPLPLPTRATIDKVVQAAAQAPVTPSDAAPAPKAVEAAPQAPLPADVQRMSVTQLLQKADALRAAHNPAEALPLYQLAAQRAPQEMPGFLGVGFSQLDLRALKQAEDAFNDALRLSSWQAEPHFGLAQALQAQGRGREAVAHYRRYLAIEPGGPRAAVARQMLEELSK